MCLVTDGFVASAWNVIQCICSTFICNQIEILQHWIPLKNSKMFRNYHTIPSSLKSVQMPEPKCYWTLLFLWHAWLLLRIGITKGSVNILPPAVNMKVKAGQYVLQVHYENSRRFLIPSDQSGIRLWAEPPLIPSLRTLKQVFYFIGHLPSIRIPADPKESDYSI